MRGSVRDPCGSGSAARHGCMKKVGFLWMGLQSLRGSMWIRMCGHSSVIRSTWNALDAAPHPVFLLARPACVKKNVRNRLEFPEYAPSISDTLWADQPIKQLA